MTNMNLISKIIFGITIILVQSISNADDVNASLLGWVGLWNEEMVEWAENENHISHLCPFSLSEVDLSKCMEKKLTEKIWTIITYELPNIKSKKIGEIIITIKPGEPFRCSYKVKNNKPYKFIPDLYDQDWGYGPYFHQTILKKKGDWIKIPLPTTYSSAWINAKYDIQKVDIISIRQGSVYMLDGEAIVLVEIKQDIIKYRMETERDFTCDGTSPPQIHAGNIKMIKAKELFDNGHLKLDLKYKRGC